MYVSYFRIRVNDKLRVLLFQHLNHLVHCNAIFKNRIVVLFMFLVFFCFLQKKYATSLHVFLNTVTKNNKKITNAP